MKNALSIATALILATPCAHATDYWVDSANGNDSSAGTSPQTAWKTITHAAATATPGAPSLIHLAPGTYDAASGEVFPLLFHGQQVVGDAGAASTVIDAGGSLAIDMHQVQGPTSNVLYSLTGVTGRNASTFARLRYAYVSLPTTFSDVRLENVTNS